MKKGLSRRGFIEKAALSGIGAMLLPGMLSPALAQPVQPLRTSRRVIYVTHSNDPFFVPVRRGFETFGALRGWRAQWVGNVTAQEDPRATRELMENALAAKPDAVGFTRIDTSSFDDVILKAKKAGIRVILYNVASPGYKELEVGFVGQDFIPAGRISGLQAAKNAQQVTNRKEGLIVLAMRAAGSTALQERTEGTRQGIEEYNKKNGTSFRSEVFITHTDPAQAISRMDAKYQADRDKIVAWAHADHGVAYCGQWAADRRLIGRFAIGGFDLIPAILEGIDKGWINWSIGQNPWAQGFVSAALLDMEMESGYPAFTYDTGAEVVDRNNIKAVIAREAKLAK